MYNISVAMAAYNGEKYIAEQIDSILKQIGQSDELIISFNPSTDGTESIITEYAAKDNRVKVLACKDKGVLNNFENAINNCKNEIIFLTDQDDVWLEGKVDKVLYYFNDEKILAVVHSGYLADKNLNIIGDIGLIERRQVATPRGILWRNQIQGSCMAFRREAISLALPFPKKIPMHDSWIGIILAKFGKVILIPDKLLLYRQHGENATLRTHGTIKNMIKQRLQLLYEYEKRKRALNKTI